MHILEYEQIASEGVENFKKTSGDIFVVDTYEEELLELFLIRNPKYRFDKNYTTEFEQFRSELLGQSGGVWFYFPWNKTLVHYLPESEYLELRTARNKNLITQAEQEKFYNSVVAVAGLSVGSHGALTIAMTGGSKIIKLADFDEISVSNLNRLRYGASTLGKNKAVLVGQYIAEVNPYARIYIFDEGVTKDNLNLFVAGEGKVPKSDIILEGVDNLEVKILLREAAKEQKIPLLMATDNGDGIIVDVERYDTNLDNKIFNGALGDFNLDTFRSFPPQELPKLATKVAGPEFIVPRMLASLMEVGRTLYSWPQLGTAATFTGVASAYLTRAILNGKNISSGKYNLNLEMIFDQDYQNEETKSKIDNERKNLLSKMGL